MKAADIERKYQEAVAKAPEPRTLDLNTGILYISGTTLLQMQEGDPKAARQTTDGDPFIPDEMYAVTLYWIYRVD